MSIEIDRLQLDIAAATVPSRATALEQRLCGAVPRAISRAIDVELGDGDQVVFIDKLVLEAHANAAWDDGAIAAALARSLLGALGRALAGPAAGITRYRERTEWVAAFIVAALDGRAWSDWRFDEFDGLRPLTMSAALRTLLLNEQGVGVDALLRLAPAGRLRALRALTAGDLAALVSAWRARRAAPVHDVARLFDAARALQGGPPELVVAALAIEEADALTLGSTLVLLAALADLVAARSRWPARAPGSEPRVRLAALAASSGVDDSVFAALADDQVAALDTAIERAFPTDATAVRSAPGSDPIAASTRYGGVFVLLAVLNWLGAAAAWRRQFEARGFGERAPALARSLALATAAVALRPRDPREVLGDSTLLRALQLTDPLGDLAANTPEVVHAIDATLRRLAKSGSDPDFPAALMPALRRMATRLLARLRERVPGCGSASAAYVRRNLLSQSATVSCDGDSAAAVCTRSPLHVLLLIAGLSACRFDCADVAIDIATERAE
jgi:hypothetical protein